MNQVRTLLAIVLSGFLALGLFSRFFLEEQYNWRPTIPRPDFVLVDSESSHSPPSTLEDSPPSK